MLIEYIGPRRNPDYPTEVRREYKDVRFKRASGADRDRVDDPKIETIVPVITLVPKGKKIVRKGVTYNFIPETSFICEVVDHEVAGELLSYSSLYKKVDSIPPEVVQAAKGKGEARVALNVNKPQSFICTHPGCDFKTTSQIGLISHTRRKHPKPVEGEVNAGLS